jgi:hypothetical protein
MPILPSDQKVDSRLLEVILDYEYLTASYKLFWFSGIFKEIIRGNQKVTFRRIVCRMIASAWYPLLQYHLDFGYSDRLNQVVTRIHNKYGINSDIKEEELLAFLENIKDTEIERSIRDFYKFVPYRLLSPFYSDVLAGIREKDKNKIIMELSQNTTKALYKILMPEGAILINDSWFEYIYRNQNIVLGWMNYKLIYYLQKKNPNVPAIPFKLSAPYQRNLTLAKKFWSNVSEQQIILDVYTNKPLIRDNFSKYGDISIDHFIPWSFVLHDELWNLVPTFKNVNSSKSNKLPNLDLYIESFCDIQYLAFSIVRRKRETKRFLEDYLNINKKLDLNDLVNTKKEITKAEFEDSMKSTILPLFQIAFNQGYELWHNNII